MDLEIQEDHLLLIMENDPCLEGDHCEACQIIERLSEGDCPAHQVPNLPHFKTRLHHQTLLRKGDQKSDLFQNKEEGEDQ